MNHRTGERVGSEIVFAGPLAVFTPLLSLSALTLPSPVLASASFYHDQISRSSNPVPDSCGLCDFWLHQTRLCGTQGNVRQHSRDDDSGGIQGRRFEQTLAR